MAGLTLEDMSDSDILRFWSKIDRRGSDDCWPWLGSPRKKDEGYGQFWLNGTNVTATRVMWVITHGSPPEHLVCHTCDFPGCMNPAHHFDGTPAANSDDMVFKDRILRGRAHPNTKVPDAIVQAIRNEYVPYRMSYRALARKYRLDRETIEVIVKRQRYAYVP